MSIFQDLQNTTLQKRIPLTVLFEITNVCDLKCVHCYIEQCEKYMKFNDLLIVLEKLEHAGTLFLTITGGEPFLHPDIFEFLKIARKRGFGISVFSNLQHLNEQKIIQLKNMGILEIGTSVYSNSSETHDSITGKPGSFNKTIKTMKLLRKHAIKVTAKYIVMKQNQMKISEMKKFISSLDAALQIDPVIVSQIGDKKIFGDQFIGIDAAHELFEEISANSEHCMSFDEKCGAAQNVIGIDVDGNIFGCLQWRASAGNIFYDEVDDIMVRLHEKYCKMYESMRYLNKDDLLNRIICRCPALMFKKMYMEQAENEEKK